MVILTKGSETKRFAIPEEAAAELKVGKKMMIETMKKGRLIDGWKIEINDEVMPEPGKEPEFNPDAPPDLFKTNIQKFLDRLK